MLLNSEDTGMSQNPRKLLLHSPGAFPICPPVYSQFYGSGGASERASPQLRSLLTPVDFPHWLCFSRRNRRLESLVTEEAWPVFISLFSSESRHHWVKGSFFMSQIFIQTMSPARRSRFPQPQGLTKEHDTNSSAGFCHVFFLFKNCKKEDSFSLKSVLCLGPSTA